jgi:hypothetical protein
MKYISLFYYKQQHVSAVWISHYQGGVGYINNIQGKRLP